MLTFFEEYGPPDNSRLVEVIARVGDLTVAMSAYWAAATARPKARIVLRQKARELAHREPQE